MNPIKRFAAAAVVAVVAVLGAAVPAQADGGTPIPEGNKPPQEKKIGAGPLNEKGMERAEALVRAWEDGDSDEALKAAAEYTAPGTTARAYANYLAHDFKAFEEAGTPSEGAVRSIDGGWELCPAADSEPIDCAQFTGWEFKGSKVANFLLCERAIDDGRLLGAGEEIRTEDAVVQLEAAFASPFNPVYTVLRVENTGKSAIKQPLAEYITADGEVIDATVSGDARVPAGATRTFEVRAVTPKGLGGTVSLSGDLQVNVPVYAGNQTGAVLASQLATAGNAGAREGCCGAQD